MKKTLCASVLVNAAAILVAGSVNASCPGGMPVQLLQDCIVVEGSGDTFPNPTYAYMGQYKEWLVTSGSSAERGDETVVAQARIDD